MPYSWHSCRSNSILWQFTGPRPRSTPWNSSCVDNVRRVNMWIIIGPGPELQTDRVVTGVTSRIVKFLNWIYHKITSQSIPVKLGQLRVFINMVGTQLKLKWRVKNLITHLANWELQDFSFRKLLVNGWKLPQISKFAFMSLCEVSRRSRKLS